MENVRSQRKAFSPNDVVPVLALYRTAPLLKLGLEALSFSPSIAFEVRDTRHPQAFEVMNKDIISHFVLRSCTTLFRYRFRLESSEIQNLTFLTKQLAMRNLSYFFQFSSAECKGNIEPSCTLHWSIFIQGITHLILVKNPSHQLRVLEIIWIPLSSFQVLTCHCPMMVILDRSSTSIFSRTNSTFSSESAFQSRYVHIIWVEDNPRFEDGGVIITRFKLETNHCHTRLKLTIPSFWQILCFDLRVMDQVDEYEKFLKIKEDFLVDLMLGRSGELGERLVDRIADPKVFVMESSSSSGSLKRAKVPGNIAQTVSCLVDGCNSDLSQCREYHRRHKVCELHSKTPKVTIGGRERRFCQQCSRFHSLVEFDEGKRSCRKRLDGHNRRRRKLQSESLSRNTGRFLSNQQGTTLLSFGSAQIFPTAVINSTWAEAFKAENNALLYINRRDNFPESSAHGYLGRSRFQILQDPNTTLLPEASISQPFGPNSVSRNSGGNHKMLSDGLSQVIGSDCALSLLSPAPAETREIGSSHMMQPCPIPPAQQLIPNLHYSGQGQFPCSQGVESKPSVSVFNSDGSSNTNLHIQGMFQNVLNGSSANEPRQQMFSFLWEAAKPSSSSSVPYTSKFKPISSSPNTSVSSLTGQEYYAIPSSMQMVSSRKPDRDRFRAGDGYVHGPNGGDGDENVDMKAESYILHVKEHFKLGRIEYE
ncbi:hypothetical protein F0562_033559 [Nyssa sinensis]|uniref:SBP-type domain-containing protein n=1 Tax=Nyssa sinensis TaxID=561372 RepID=A0A5J5ADC2_9ASTE|nr:hypothetical protein F0562_033559 [Nyssa sinensis]